MEKSNIDKACIFIDGSNLYHNLKKYRINIFIEDIIKILETKRKIINIFYYTALLDKEYNLNGYLEQKKFLDNIKKIPNLIIRYCNLRKIILKDNSISYSIKGDDVYLTTDLIKGAYENLYDTAIIVSGDEDFIPAIKVVQNKGKIVINAYFPKSSSYLLRKYCNNSFNLKKKLSDSSNKRSPDMA
ncbi:MAG: NYN domain-containing protein [Candidatus Pacearchaeota archaeon]|jgi:uncharacterized LabA/DUF88 family protein